MTILDLAKECLVVWITIKFFNEASKFLNACDKFWRSIKERSTGWSENRCQLPDICNSKLSFCYMYSFVAKARMFNAVCNWRLPPYVIANYMAGFQLTLQNFI